MFGATLETYTLFHTAEDAASVPYLYEPGRYVLKVLGHNGVQDVVMRRQNMRFPRSFQEKKQWLEQRGLLQQKALGRGELLYIPSAASMHRALLDALKSDPMFLAGPAK
jgi:hypothetical protein